MNVLPSSRSKRTSMRVVLLLGLCSPILLLGAPDPAIAASSQTDSATVRVVVDARDLGETSEVYEEEIGAKLRAALEQAGYTPDDSIRADATVRVRVSFFNEADLDYQVEVDISAGAAVVALETLGCPQCVDEDLLSKIGSQHPQVIAGLGRALDQAGEGPKPAAEDEPPTPPSTDAPRAITALGGAGIGVTVVGAGMLVAGGVELGRGRIYDEIPTAPAERTGIDHRPVGGALLGAGVLVFSAGVTMLVVDLVRSGKRRRQHAGRAHLLLGPAIVGLGYSGRF